MEIKKLTHFSLKCMNIVFFMIFCIYTLEIMAKIEIIGEKINLILVETIVFSYILLNLAPLSRELNEKSLKIFSACYYLAVLTTLFIDTRFSFVPFFIVVFCLYSLRNILSSTSSIFPILLLAILVSPVTYMPLFSVLFLLVFFISFNLDVLKSKDFVLPIIVLITISASFSLVLDNVMSFEVSLSVAFMLISLFLPKEFYTYRKFFMMFDLSFLIALITTFFVIKVDMLEYLVFQSVPLFFVLYTLSLFKISRSVGVVKGNPEKVFFIVETVILIQAILFSFMLGNTPLFSVLITEVVTLGVFLVKIHDILKTYRESIKG